MKRLLLAMMLLAWLPEVSEGAEGRTAAEAPENILAHFTWCAAAEAAATRLTRYEGFWKQRHPEDEEYEDAVHAAFVRRCAFRLAGGALCGDWSGEEVPGDARLAGGAGSGVG